MNTSRDGSLQFSKLIHQQLKELHKMCRRKCIANFDSSNLSRAEDSCLDRCVFKYNEANNLMAKFMQQEQFQKSLSS